MKRIIVNGANGYLASNFVYDLLSQNYEVIALVRGVSDEAARDRMLEALSKLSADQTLSYDNLTVYSYALLEDDFSMTAERLVDVFDLAADYYHFAASLKFSEKAKDEIFRTNISGVENSINVFQKNARQDARFFFISTAYSCGAKEGAFEEKFYNNEGISGFRNYYENSKRYAENIIRERIEDGVDAHIIRPSQVVGSRKTGVTKTDFGIFDFTKRVSSLASRYPGESIRIKVNPSSTQNLIPIDTIVYYLMQTVLIEKLPTIINFVAKNPIKNSVIIDHLNTLLPINIKPRDFLDKSKLTPLERIVNIGMSFTGDYVDTNINFSTTNLDTISKGKDVEITDESLKQMINYFVDSITRDNNVKALAY